MPLTPGTKLGPYEIIAPLGAGGMGEVYRAKDTRLGRDVAVKVLPQHLSDQPDVRARFEREAKTISSLNHPNICMLFDVGREGDTDYLVMELIDGETLADRLKRGALGPADQLRYGAQIADALDRAHRAGVIHRDLKPGNVMITRSGAKLMDFGLSRATVGGMPGSSSAHSVLTLSHSPTFAPQVTAEGMLLGTFQYMAPELLEGKDADARSDIWALGCVLYEMATARHAFEGRSQASLIAAILEREPAVIGEVPSASGVVAGNAPPHGMERLIRNCLVKDPEERIQTAHDVKLRLQEIAETAGIGSLSSVSSSPSVIAAASSVAAAPRARAAAGPLPWVLAALGVIAAIGVYAWLAPKAFAPKAPATRFLVGAPDKTTDMYWPRVSPDGRYLLFQATDSSGTLRAYVRPMDQIEAHAIPGTEGLQRAYWSPDSKEIVFVAGSKLQRVAIAGGSPVIITAAPGGADISWSSKGQILMDASFTDSIKVVPAGGGELRPASRIYREDQEVGSAWPSFLPDGEHFLFMGQRGDGNTANMRLGRLGSLDSKLLGQSDGRVEYGGDGWIVFIREATLFAQKLDVAAGKLVGQPITIADGLRVGGAQGHFSLSPGGVLAFVSANGGGLYTLRTADRTGKLTGTPIGNGLLTNPKFSPDGTKILYLQGERGLTFGGDVHVYDLQRETDTRLTFTGNDAYSPQWSPDGRRFAYSTRSSGGKIRIGSSDGLGSQDSIPAGYNPTLSQWASAGSRIVGFTNAATGFAVNSDGPDRAVRGLPDSTMVAAMPVISPDGRWVAFVSGTLPNIQIYVQSLEGPPGRWQVSTRPAAYPQWTKGGRELIYQDQSGAIYAVDIDTRTSFAAGTPRQIMTAALPGFGISARTWAADDAGERFVLMQRTRADRAGEIEVVTRFSDLVTRK